jgi:hypothetical protein
VVVVVSAAGGSATASVSRTVAAAAVASGLAGADGVLSPDGRIGELRIDRSGPADIRRFAGHPAMAGRGRTNATFASFVPWYEAFGYRCSRRPHSLGFDPGGARPWHVHCQTVYFVNPRTGRLADFWTDSTAFRTDRGSRARIHQAVADRLERAHAHVGALTGISRRTKAATLFVENAGCKSVGNPNTSPCLGGLVSDLIVEGHHPVGLLEDGLTK